MAKHAGPVESFLQRRSPVWFRLWPRQLAWLHARKASRRLRRLAWVTTAEQRLQADFEAALRGLMEIAEAREWSRKKLVEEVGVSWGTFDRALKGTLDRAAWLPQLRAAAAKLSA